MAFIAVPVENSAVRVAVTRIVEGLEETLKELITPESERDLTQNRLMEPENKSKEKKCF